MMFNRAPNPSESLIRGNGTSGTGFSRKRAQRLPSLARLVLQHALLRGGLVSHAHHAPGPSVSRTSHISRLLSTPNPALPPPLVAPAHWRPSQNGSILPVNSITGAVDPVDDAWRSGSGTQDSDVALDRDQPSLRGRLPPKSAAKRHGWHVRAHGTVRAEELGPVCAGECGAGGEELGGESGVPRVAKRMWGEKREEWELEQPRMCKGGLHAWKGRERMRDRGKLDATHRAGSVES